MNQCFRSPLVAANKGRADGGGATVTELGEQILADYRQLQDEVERVVEARLSHFSKHVRAPR